jgi:hypothetical protein
MHRAPPPDRLAAGPGIPLPAPRGRGSSGALFPYSAQVRPSRSGRGHSKVSLTQAELTQARPHNPAMAPHLADAQRAAHEAPRAAFRQAQAGTPAPLRARPTPAVNSRGSRESVCVPTAFLWAAKNKDPAAQKAAPPSPPAGLAPTDTRCAGGAFGGRARPGPSRKSRSLNRICRARCSAEALRRGAPGRGPRRRAPWGWANPCWGMQGSRRDGRALLHHYSAAPDALGTPTLASLHTRSQHMHGPQGLPVFGRPGPGALRLTRGPQLALAESTLTESTGTPLNPTAPRSPHPPLLPLRSDLPGPAEGLPRAGGLCSRVSWRAGQLG